MKLYYYRDRRGNFGDDLNPWLWPRLLPPGFLDDDASSLFVGIGTILGRHVPAAPTKWVMGSGTGYSQCPPLDDTWQFMCVRGPMTAKALGLAPELAATDPAALLNREAGLTGVSRSGVAYMPHHTSASHYDWKSLCDRAEVTYIDPRGSVDSTLAILGGSELVITESLHGAIVADALRIPWIPVVCYDHILAFKWLDWAASLGLDYHPVAVPGLWDRESGLPWSDRSRNAVKRVLRTAGMGTARWAGIPDANSAARRIDDATRTITELARSRTGILSSDGALSAALTKLDRAIERVVAAAHATPPDPTARGR